MKLVSLAVLVTLAAATPTLVFKTDDDVPDCEMSQHADSSNNPYIGSSCGLSIKGDSYFSGKIGVEGHSDVKAWVQKLSDQVAAAAANIEVINSQLEAAKVDMGNFQQDVVAETMCAGLVGWNTDSRTISGKEAGYGAKTCDEVCSTYGQKTYGKTRGIYTNRKWSCVRGATRIAPYWPSKYNFFHVRGGGEEHPDHNSFYWRLGCHDKLGGNGRTYCCCRAEG
eukprot:g1285.t1